MSCSILKYVLKTNLLMIMKNKNPELRYNVFINVILKMPETHDPVLHWVSYIS
jgi:hypothetical protein